MFMHAQPAVVLFLTQQAAAAAAAANAVAAAAYSMERHSHPQLAWTPLQLLHLE
jgi:hypothetical protein